MSKDIVTLHLRQGEIHATMEIDKETVNMMIKIHKENPNKWISRDFDLLHEACDRLKN